jgi:hypothetical protein
VLFLLAGPGRFSVDHFIFGEKGLDASSEPKV